jgi:hypothetical protein
MAGAEVKSALHDELRWAREAVVDRVVATGTRP